MMKLEGEWNNQIKRSDMKQRLLLTLMVLMGLILAIAADIQWVVILNSSW